MKITFILCFIMVFAALADAQSLDCKKFRNGTFKMTYNGKNAIIERKGNKQDEYLDGSGTPTFSFIVKWLDNCTYTLDPTAETRKKHPGIPEDGLMTVTIVKTNANSYHYTAFYSFDKKTIHRSELTRIK